MGRKEIKMKRLGLNTIPLTSISKIPRLSLTLAPRILNPFLLFKFFLL